MEPPAQFIEPTDTIRVAAREAVLQELEAIGSRRKQLLSDADDELERLAAFLPVANTAGIPQKEIAERAAVSRQTLVNLRNEGRGHDDGWSLDLQVMLMLAFGGPRTIESLTSSLPSMLGDEQATAAVLKRLLDADAAAWAGAAMSGQSRHDYFKLTGRGVEELPRRLREAAIPENKRWPAYVAAAEDEAEQLAEVGQSIVGEDRVGFIPARTTKGMERPEVAFDVEAPSFSDAISRAAEFYARLRDAAGLEPETAHVTAVVPPNTRARATEQLRPIDPGKVEADFERLRSDVQAELKPHPPTPHADTEDIDDLAKRMPAAAIVEAHMRIEKELRHALASIGDAPSQTEEGSALARRALEHSLVTAQTVNAIEGATVMRNLAVHGPRREVSVQQAQEYVAIANAVLYAIRQNVSSASKT